MDHRGRLCRALFSYYDASTALILRAESNLSAVLCDELMTACQPCQELSLELHQFHGLGLRPNGRPMIDHSEPLRLKRDLEDLAVT